MIKKNTIHVHKLSDLYIRDYILYGIFSLSSTPWTKIFPNSDASDSFSNIVCIRQFCLANFTQWEKGLHSPSLVTWGWWLDISFLWLQLMFHHTWNKSKAPQNYKTRERFKSMNLELGAWGHITFALLTTNALFGQP